ncbi:MAG: LysM peptidoglycan-binding domain-containing protein, partial [Firmicutes bacterium]|nr:LysM peptidoglycan-binding domain-containing protein [Bacillota bacterium]
DFWSVTSDIWNAGVAIALSLQLVSGAASWILTAIGSIFGNVAGKLGIGGIPLAIGLLTVGIQLKEAQAEGSYEAFARNVLVAALVGAIGGAVFGSGGALMGFNLALSFKLGDALAEGLEQGRDAFGEKVGIPREHWDKLEEYEEYRQKMIDEATAGMGYFEKLWWQLSGKKPEGLLSFSDYFKETGTEEEKAFIEEYEKSQMKRMGGSYIVQQGDTLPMLYREYYSDLIENYEEFETLWKQMNPMLSPTVLRPGDVLNMPTFVKAEAVELTESMSELNDELKTLDDLLDFPDMTEENIRKAIELLTAITGAEVDPELVMLLARLESGAKWGEGVTHIVHPESGAMGPLQSMPIARRDVDNRGGLGGQENLHSWIPGMSLEDNWVAQTEYGIRYIQLLLDRESEKIERVAEELGISFAEALFLSYQEGVNALNNAALSGELDKDFSMLATGHRRTIEEQLVTYHNFTEGGEAIIDTWADGMLNKKPRVEASAEELAQTVADFLIGQSPPPKGPLSNIKLGMKNTIDAGIEGAEEGLLGGIERLLSPIQKIGEAAQAWGRDLVHYFIEGVEEEATNQQVRMEKIASRILM